MGPRTRGQATSRRWTGDSLKLFFAVPNSQEPEPGQTAANLSRNPTRRLSRPAVIDAVRALALKMRVRSATHME